jgi:GNAT superfamily N-acetyltransferase
MDLWANRAVSRTEDGNRVGKGSPIPVNRLGEQSAERMMDVGRVSSYPRDLEGDVTLDDGVRLRMRPVRPDDEPGLEDLYSRLSQLSAYQRFFTFRRRLPSDWYQYFANVDYRRRLALVAEQDTPNGAALVGVGRYEPTDEEGVAEVALVVQDDWQGRGLGEALLNRVLAAAEARGIRRFRALVLAENYRMLNLLSSRTNVLERKLVNGVVTLSFDAAMKSA